ncbi:MAG TPA: CAP domain-containing protein [Clostridia bacterium]|nr:CAP domain-containing protein [Clostridia bacterium]
MKRFAYVFTAIMFIILLASGCQKAPVSVSPNPTVTIAPTIAPTVKPTATVKPTPTATPVPTPTLPPEAFAELVLEKVNNARIENGLEPLEMSPSLCAAAAIRADETRQKLDEKNGEGYILKPLTNQEAHTRLNGDSFATVIDEIGITSWEWASENLTYSSQSDIGVSIDAHRAFTAWKNSPDHWKAILYKNYTKTGIAVVYSNGIAYACQLFTTGHKEAPEYANPSPTITP